jgi:EAL domain-containing protein (putative c-di-GMP-specific phosphodiesterase class I)
MPVAINENDNPHHSEIIIRAKDNQGNVLPTQDFILAAEHYNRITILDRWVVTSVLEWMQQHQDEMPSIGGFAINLSGRSLNDADFLDFIYASVTEAGIPTDWICFEITETADINDLSDVAEFIIKIKETGCHFSLDDFGSGLASYAYLKTLPVDYLKIDGTFVKNMHENPNDYAVVKSICDIGHFMGKKIIAEFVENDEILELLRNLGVDYAQGWGIEKPQPLFNTVK